MRARLNLLPLRFPAMPEIVEGSFLRSRSVLTRYGISRVTLWRHVRAGRFPPPVKLFDPSPTLFWALADLRKWESERASPRSEQRS